MHVLAKAIFHEGADLPGREIKLIRDRGPSNIQLSSSRDLTSLSSFAINSDLRAAEKGRYIKLPSLVEDQTRAIKLKQSLNPLIQEQSMPLTAAVKKIWLRQTFTISSNFTIILSKLDSSRIHKDPSRILIFQYVTLHSKPNNSSGKNISSFFHEISYGSNTLHHLSSNVAK